MMFIDANIFILAALGQTDRAVRCRRFLERVERAEQPAMTSVLVLAEVLKVLNRRLKSRPESASFVQHLMASPNLKVCGIERLEFEESIFFFSQGLNPNDSLHAATMRAHGLSEVLSFDVDFERIEGIRRVEP
ncbi:MAG: type II toxin-antitoxin system VapC family toxin [Candidatus Micrarchaeota archaeon]